MDPVNRAREAESFISEDTILAVKKGANWLDERYPSWESQIDLNVLYLGSAHACVLGQLEQSYTKACNKHNIRGEDAVEMGFDLNPIELEGCYVHLWEELTNAWKELIESRRELGK